MQTFVRSIMVAALAAFCATELAAQAASPTMAVEQGDRIRIQGPWGSAARIATVETVTSDSLTLRVGATHVERVAIADVTKVERSAGQRRPFIKYALIGLVAGAASGAIIGAASYEEPAEGDWCILGCSRSSDAAFAGAALGAVGLVVGGIVGLVPRDSWRPASLPVRTGYSSRGFTLGLSYSLR